MFCRAIISVFEALRAVLNRTDPEKIPGNGAEDPPRKIVQTERGIVGNGYGKSISHLVVDDARVSLW